MKFKKQYYLFAISFYLCAVVLHIALEYVDFKKELYQQIDAKLKTAAYSIPQILPPSFHQNTLNKTSISMRQDLENINRLTKESNLFKVKIIYSLIEEKGKIYFTSCCTTPEELKEHKEVHFFDPYADAPIELSKTFSSGKTYYAEYTDQWGTFRSIFVPLKTDSGSRYVVAADVDISFIKEQLTDALLNSAIEVLFYIVILLPIFLLYYRHMNEITLGQEIIIEQRTHELTLAKEAAENSEHAKSEFLATMSHEIRTPMNGVLGMLSLLERSNMNVEQKNQLRIASSSATSLLALINDILDFSKIEAGKMDLENIPFNLGRELNDFTEAITFKANEKGLKLILDTSTLNNQTIVADAGRIRQILTNLVGNAIKFTHKGSITIKVTLTSINETSARLKMDVSDTGIGIPQSKLQTLFDPFIQADGSTTRKYGGTGLGLSIVKNLCSLMDGSVSIQSTLGSGSMFSVDVLVGLSNEFTTANTLQSIAPTHDDEILWPSTTRILLVEDNPTNQMVAQGMLDSMGLYADIAANGIEALESIKLSTKIAPYTIILMDCQMPEMDGYEASRAIRDEKAGVENKSIPIIAMTANAMTGDREKCVLAGMDDYLSKPIDITVLKNMLIKWIFDGKELPVSTQPPAILPTTETLMLWDQEESLMRLGGKEALLKKIVESFLKEAPVIIKALSLAIKEDNIEKAQLNAHSLKGSAANIGALAFSELAKKIEFAAKENNLTTIKTLYPDFKECYIATTTILLNHYEINA